MRRNQSILVSPFFTMDKSGQVSMKKRKLLFIVNPKSGKAQIKPHLLEILNIFTRAGYEVTTHITQCQGDAKDVARDRGKEYDLLACSGGDGTLDEVVNGMMQGMFQIPVCYIPAGSTNDFAGSLGIPKNMERAAYLAVKGKPFACDLGKFNGNIFVYVAAFGMFTEVSYDTDQSLKNVLGHAAYILKGVQSLSTIKSYPMRFVYEDAEDGEKHVIEGKFIFGMITNSISVGGFKNITGKNVELNDGQFEVTLIRLPGSTQELNQMVTSLVERNPRDEFIYWFKTAHLEVEAKEDIAWTLDGEFGGVHDKVTISDEKEAFVILTPPDKKSDLLIDKKSDK